MRIGDEEVQQDVGIDGRDRHGSIDWTTTVTDAFHGILATQAGKTAAVAGEHGPAGGLLQADPIRGAGELNRVAGRESELLAEFLGDGHLSFARHPAHVRSQ